MEIIKAYKFRLYPTVWQAALARKTAGCCRLVKNLHLEQRSSFSRNGRFVGYVEGASDLPALKAAFPFFKDAPAQCLQQALLDLDTAFRNFFSGRAGYPRPARKYGNESFRFPQPSQFRIGQEFIELPKFGRVAMKKHRAVEGRVLTATVSIEGDRFYVSIVTTIDIEAPLRAVRDVGIDLNVATGAVTSDGLMLVMPKTSSEEMRKLARLQKDHSRRKKGSRNREKARRALIAFHAKVRRRRMDAAHKASRRLADGYSHIAFEALKLRNMTASARGTVAMPGRKVRAKAALNRVVLDSALGAVRRFSKYKATWVGGVTVEVDAAYTSQNCSRCGQHPKSDPATAHMAHGRISRDEFECPLCGFVEHADVNAARNILALGRLQWAAFLTAGGAPAAACGGLRGKTRLRNRKRESKAASAC